MNDKLHRWLDSKSDTKQIVIVLLVMFVGYMSCIYVSDKITRVFFKCLLGIGCELIVLWIPLSKIYYDYRQRKIQDVLYRIDKGGSGFNCD